MTADGWHDPWKPLEAHLSLKNQLLFCEDPHTAVHRAWLRLECQLTVRQSCGKFSGNYPVPQRCHAGLHPKAPTAGSPHLWRCYSQSPKGRIKQDEQDMADSYEGAIQLREEGNLHTGASPRQPQKDGHCMTPCRRAEQEQEAERRLPGPEGGEVRIVSDPETLSDWGGQR